jgi:hypothetical protein
MNITSLRKRMKSVLKRVNRLSRRLEEDAKEIRAVDQFLKLGFDFPDEMEHCAEYLKGSYTEEVKSTVLSRGSGLQAELVDAVQLVRMATGRPHYPELAELIRVLSGKPTGEDDLRKTVSNFGESFYRGSRSPKQIQSLVERGNVKWGKLRKTLQKRRRPT